MEVGPAAAIAASVNALGLQKVIALTLQERDITPQTDLDDMIRLYEELEVTCEQLEITPRLHVIRKNLAEFDSDDRVT